MSSKVKCLEISAESESNRRVLDGGVIDFSGSFGIGERQISSFPKGDLKVVMNKKYKI